jgi:hypothetical protein
MTSIRRCADGDDIGMQLRHCCPCKQQWTMFDGVTEFNDDFTEQLRTNVEHKQ